MACSWSFGSGYYHAPRPELWLALVLAGAALVIWSQQRCACPGLWPADAWVWAGAGLLLVPVVVWAPWPHRLAPLLMALGAGLGWLARTWRAWAWMAQGAVLAGGVWWAQDVGLALYRHATARSHELFWPLPQLLAGIMRLVGVEAAVEGTSLMLPTMRQTHALGATWELWMDPGTVCFLAGGFLVVMLWVRASTLHSAKVGVRAPDSQVEPGPEAAKRRPRPRPTRVRGPGSKGQWAMPGWGRALALWFGAVVVWLPLRAGLLMAVYLHRALHTDYDSNYDLMSQFWNPWLNLVLLVPLALLQGRWMRRLWPEGPMPSPAPEPASDTRRQRGWSLAAGTAGAALLLSLGIYWDPVGERKGGRVGVDEFHSKWEPTDRPFDTEWYGHLSGYNYACIYDYSSRFYEMSRLTHALTDGALANLDVLVVKVPTERFAASEIGAIARFVENGGGLLLVGEHTDVFGTGYNLNTIARRFGFEFRYDCLFGIDSFFDQYYEPTFVPHPVVQHVQGMDFATSCSIDPRLGWGRGVITSTGLKNSMADYHVSNYYPQAVDHAAMRFGAFVQLWAVRHGRGRVLAFTDSTIFSNFSAFEPGKAELWLGMVEWLNRSDGWGHTRPWWLVLGAAWLAWCGLKAWSRPCTALTAVASAALAWTLTTQAIVSFQRHRMPPPPALRPFKQVVLDRTVCRSPLSKNGFIEGKNDGFGIFERWVLRLGYFTQRASGPESFRGDLLIFLWPNQPASTDYVRSLARYVEAGGRVLLLDSSENTNSTARTLLEPFSMSLRPRAGGGGTLATRQGLPPIPVGSALEVVGGQPFARLEGLPVAALSRFGKGTVAVVGFGSRFADAHMGVTGDVEPNAELRKVFDFEFALLRGLVEGTLSGP